MDDFNSTCSCNFAVIVHRNINWKFPKSLIWLGWLLSYYFVNLDSRQKITKFTCSNWDLRSPRRRHTTRSESSRWDTKIGESLRIGLRRQFLKLLCHQASYTLCTQLSIHSSMEIHRLLVVLLILFRASTPHTVQLRTASQRTCGLKKSRDSLNHALTVKLAKFFRFL